MSTKTIYTITKALDVQPESGWIRNCKEILPDAWLALVHCDHLVKFALLDDSVFEDFAYIRDVHIFSQTGEIYLWRDEDVFNGRLRIDHEIAQKETAQIEVYDETHLMWGTKPGETLGHAVPEGCSILVEENRGMAIEIPIPELTEQHMPLSYTIRNYYTFDDVELGADLGLGLIRFDDARLVSLQDNKKNYLRRESCPGEN